MRIRTSKIIVENDSHVAIKAIFGQTPTPKLIMNLVKDIKSLPKILEMLYFLIVVGKQIC